MGVQRANSRRSVRYLLGAGMLTGIVGVCVVAPLGWAAIRIVVGLVEGFGAATSAEPRTRALQTEFGAVTAFEPWLLLRTLGVALLIAALSTALAWPLAWRVRAIGWRLGAWLVTPALLPAYLIYAGLSAWRAPGTRLGDLIEHAAAAAAPGSWLGELPRMVGHSAAFAALIWWATPLAVLVLAIGLERVPAGALAAAALDAGWWGRFSIRLALGRAAVAASILVVGVLMLGSAIPLHVARVDTYAIRVWLAMDLLPAALQWRAWWTAWPLVLIAGSVGMLMSRFALSPPSGSKSAEVEAAADGRESRLQSRWSAAAAMVVVLALPGFPLVALALSLRQPWSTPSAPGALMRIVTENIGPIGTSLLTAAMVGWMAIVLTLTVWQGLSTNTPRGIRRWVAWNVRLLIISGLLPGMLVGSWIAGLWNDLATITGLGLVSQVRDSLFVVVAAHVARFGMIAALLGCWLAVSAPRDLTDQQVLDGADHGRGWWVASVTGRVGMLAAVGLMVCALSFQEIESAILVQPPGWESVPRLVLGFLHFARTEELSAAGVWLGVAGAACAGLVAWLAGRDAADYR